MMHRIDKVFARWEQWAERNSKVLGAAAVLLVFSVFAVSYYFTRSLHAALLAVAFLPLVLIMGTALVGFILASALVSIDLLAEKLARRGLPYWLAFLCMIGLLVTVLLIFLIDWGLSAAMR